MLVLGLACSEEVAPAAVDSPGADTAVLASDLGVGSAEAESTNSPDAAPSLADAPPAVDSAPPVEDPVAEAAPSEASERVVGSEGVVHGKVKQGQTLFDGLVAAGFTAPKIQPAINSLSKVFDFRKSRPGHSFSVRYGPAGEVFEIQYQTKPETAFVTTWDPAKKVYDAKEKTVPLERKVVTLGGTVQGSLYRAVLKAGEQHGLISGFIDMFAYDINFATETKSGDTFRIVFEKVMLDGKFLRYGHILAAEYKGKKKSLRAYRFEGDGSYYDHSGQSLRRMFLRNPVKFSRITSRFGRRKHPILKTYKMHNGVDYAAPRGTPVSAIASGTIAFAGRKGANGNLVSLKHANGWHSYYAHLSKFAKGIKTGSKIKQGTVIGYVGSTGRSTGPHLHLGIRDNKGYIDPLSVHSTRGSSLRGKRLARFKGAVAKLDRVLDKVKILPPVAAEPEAEQSATDMGSDQ